ncbi:hypothetical protein FCK90_00060 [Kocuria coralli]|uniref:Uncharacterized protein n=1 Tax=Kocuria coralli TaxID=1461025 RepID=A0A5J5L0L7_9MICC|nr:hypothetical protein [Kocuria coralli]KAA9395467.1 hypothetical protein FCK90_00060 [Kocuria coralli]
MENNYGDASHDEATQALGALATDSQRLAQRVQVPWALMAAFGITTWLAGAACRSAVENLRRG